MLGALFFLTISGGCPQLLANLKINAWTPTKDYILFEGPVLEKEIIREAKDIIIQRLLTRRLDVMTAFRHDLLTIRNGVEAIAGRLAVLGQPGDDYPATHLQGLDLVVTTDRETTSRRQVVL